MQAAVDSSVPSAPADNKKIQEVFMGKVLLGTTMSLDGFINDRNGSVDPLYPDLEALRKTEMLQQSIDTTGAVVMGRHAYDMAQGDLTGYEYQVPIFVLTHHPPEKAAKGVNEKLTLTFVTDGIKSAVEQAKRAAGDKYVLVLGGASTSQQALRARLFDEIEIGIMPVILGEGLRFFELIGAEQIQLEKIRVYQAPDRTDIRFRRVN
jgi:dihydrofolate reductase